MAIRLRVTLNSRLHSVDWHTLALRARASLNPNSSVTDLPVFVAELKDIPGLYRYLMQLWIKGKGRMPPSVSGTAQGNIVAQFGILPLISDILSLFDFAEAVRRREEHLRRLGNGNERFSRRLDNYSYSIDLSNEIVYSTRVANIRTITPLLVTCKRQSWFTARATAVVPTAGENPRLARDLVLGINSLSVSQIYELIPWSWLIDYFTNVGLILKAYRGGIEFDMKPPTIMVKDEVDSGLLILGSWPHGSSVYAPPPVINFTKKRRQVVPLSPTWLFRRPYLTASQLSILASLLVVRSPSVRKIAS